MIRIVSFKICPFVQRVTGLLEAKNVPYEIEYISLKDKPQWFLDLSPTGQVPMLITDGGKPLFESDAIVEYIDEVTAPLQEELSAEDRALNRAWSYQASKHYLVQCSTMQSADRETFETRNEKLKKAYARAEQQLLAGPFFSGGKLGNVDIAWLPLLHRSALVEKHSGFDMLEGFPKVKAWQQAVLKSGVAERSVSPDFVPEFSGFYLSERTWLGRGALEGEPAATVAAAGGGGCCG